MKCSGSVELKRTREPEADASSSRWQAPARLGSLVAMVLLCLSPLASSAGDVSPDLRDLARSRAPEETIAVLIRLRDALDLRAFREDSERRGDDRATRRRRLVRSLKLRTERTSGALQALLAREGARRVRMLWIHNGLAAEIPLRLLDEIAGRPEVRSVRLDGVVRMAELAPAATAPAGWNLTAVGAPALWAEGHTGQGVIVAGMDTGVDPFHPDIGPKQRPGSSWFDPYGEHATPYDATGHGTQAMGLILGGDHSGQPIGMAPDASWIAAKLFNDAGDGVLGDIHAGYQWLLDPDGNPGSDDLPDIVNSSWTFDDVDQCELEFEPDIAALRAADVAVVFSAGNFGPSPSTSVSPANNPGGLAVGAVDALLSVASFSSRGPSSCASSIYPQLSAPGVNVYTADLTLAGTFPDSWVTVTGTSFAAAHVSGALALLQSAHTGATPLQLETALLAAAQDLGVAGPDQDSGWGLLDVEAAHQILAAPAVPGLSLWALVLLTILLLPIALRRS